MASVEVLVTTACDFPLYMVHTACTACSYLSYLFFLHPKLEGIASFFCAQQAQSSSARHGTPVAWGASRERGLD